MPHSIRDATRDDLQAIVALVRALADFEKLPGPDAAAEARLVDDFERERFKVLVAELDGRVVGFALYFMTYSTFLGRPSLYLEDLFVLREARRLGIGTAFFRRLIEMAKDLGCGRFEWTVLDWNEAAQNFYRSLGADVLPDWRICRMLIAAPSQR
jgi:GNAT superfamily N-acetyltransferase